MGDMVAVREYWVERLAGYQRWTLSAKRSTSIIPRAVTIAPMAAILDTPESATAAIQALAGKVRRASEKNTPLRIRGGGSKDFYGQRLHGDVLDMRMFAGVVEYEPSELVVTALAVAAGDEASTVQLKTEP
jgi:hypothetical protein